MDQKTFYKSSFLPSKVTFEVVPNVRFGKPRVVCRMKVWQSSSSGAGIFKEQKTLES